MTNVATRLKALEEGYEDLVAGLYRAALGQGSITNKNIKPKSVTAGLIDVDELAAVAASTGDLSVSGTVTIGAGGSIVDGDGSTWDQSGITLKATGVQGDNLLLERDGYTPTGSLQSLIDTGTVAVILEADSAASDGNAFVSLTGVTSGSSSAVIGAGNGTTETRIELNENGTIELIDSSQVAAIMTATKTLVTISSAVRMTGLPTADPGVAGRLWNDAGTVKISL